MAGPRKGKLPQTKIAVSIPNVLIEKIEETIRGDGSATSVADFLRQAAVKEIARRRGEHSEPDEDEAKTIRRIRGE